MLRRFPRGWWLPALLLLLLLLTPDFQGDSETLVRDAQGIIGCMRSGVLVGCREAGVYAPFQVFVALFFRLLGIPPKIVLSLLAHLSVVYFALSLKLVFDTLRTRSLQVAWLGLFTMITGCILTYARSSFGEMGAVFLTLGFLSACLLKKGCVEVAAFLCLASLTKDTALAFLLFSGAICWRYSPVPDRSAPGTRLLSFVLGALAGALVVTSFNYFRFGTFHNSGYLVPEFLVTSPRIQASFFAAIWASPSGGVLEYWPTFAVFLAAATAVGAPKKSLPLAGIWVLLAALTFGFSKWYAPLGWWSWGPRLIIPWLPASVLVLGFFHAAELESLLRWLGRSKLRSWTAFAALTALSLPHFLFLFHPEVWLECFRPARDFTGASPTIQSDPVQYYVAMLSALWKPELVPALLFTKPIKAWQWLLTAAYLYTLFDVWKRIREGSGSTPPLRG